MEKDYYLVLGISSNATAEEIKKAFRINAIRYHPDKNFGNISFTNKFLEIKEAYDNLIDPVKRNEFDKFYQAYFTSETSKETSRYSFNEEKKKKKKEEPFDYIPFENIFSESDRKQQKTEPVSPKITPNGKPLAKNIQFLFFPKNIGKIIVGASNILKGAGNITPLGLVKKLAKTFLKIIVVCFILAVLHYLFLISQYNENPLLYILLLWSIIPALLILGLYSLNFMASTFHGYNYYVGINGFAFYKFKNSESIPIEKMEINFNEITDIYCADITSGYAWVNRNSKKAIYTEPKGDDKIDYDKLDLNICAEKYFTIYLLDNLENELEQNGFIQFNLLPVVPCIRLGIGFITFLKDDESITYKFNEIKRMYSKENSLYIEHKNFEKHLFFFKSGNQNSIPLKFLSNRQFFFKAMEILLGYKIN